MLDMARQTYKEVIEDCIDEAGEHARARPISHYKYSVNCIGELELPIIPQFEHGRAVYLSIADDAISINELPSNFINITQRGKHLRFTTLELMKKNARMADALHEVLLMSESAVQKMIEGIIPKMRILWKASEALALLDMVPKASLCHDVH